LNPKDLQRFWLKVEKTNTCWEWKGGLQGPRYGSFWFNGKQIRAHRFAYELFKGEIPNGLQIDHLCRNRACVNPEHLEIVSCKENVLRGIGVCAKNSKKTHCPRGHELKEDNLDKHHLRIGQRTCKTCLNEKHKLLHKINRQSIEGRQRENMYSKTRYYRKKEFERIQ